MAKWKRFQHRVEKLAEKYHESPITEIYSPRLSDLPQPPPAWSKFYRLSEALNHARSSSSELRVFAVEPESDISAGKREFITSSYDEFWFYYSQLKDGSKHFYEVIEEGVVCHLYFDVEFIRKYNPGVDGEQLVDELISLVCGKLKKDFNITCTSTSVLRLDSSNDIKFSQHLIFHTPNAVFRSSYDAGWFVKTLCSDNWDTLTIEAEENQLQCVVDLGVYTKNRNFRLFQSTKKGKTTALLRSKRCLFDFGHTDVKSSCCVVHTNTSTGSKSKQQKKVADTDLDKKIFYASLITNVKFNDSMRVLSAPDALFTRPLSSHNENTGKQPVHTEEGNVSCSPYPELHAFITSLVRGDSTQGCITKWTYFPCSHMVLYAISGNRYCHNIERQHKSNHIFYVADLSQKVCYQKCHDPHCHGYRSPPIDLPKEVLDSLKAVDLEVTDDELLDFVNSLDQNDQNNKERKEEVDLEKSEVEEENGDGWGNVTDEDLLEAVELP